MQTFSIAWHRTSDADRLLGLLVWRGRRIVYFPNAAGPPDPSGWGDFRLWSTEFDGNLAAAVAQILGRANVDGEFLTPTASIEAPCFRDAARRAAQPIGARLTVRPCDHGLGLPDDLEEVHARHRLTLDVVCALLVRGNTATQFVYADVTSPSEWSRISCTLWVGPADDQMRPLVRFGDMGGDGVWVWEGRYDWDEGTDRAFAVFGRESDPAPTDVPNRIAARVGMTLAARPPRARTRYAIWGRMFAAARAVLAREEAEPPHWCMFSAFHGGWNKYYLRFRPLREPNAFRLSEQGHLADVPIRRRYNLRNPVLAGRGTEPLAEHLRGGLRRAGALQDGRLAADATAWPACE